MQQETRVANEQKTNTCIFPISSRNKCDKTQSQTMYGDSTTSCESTMYNYETLLLLLYFFCKENVYLKSQQFIETDCHVLSYRWGTQGLRR